MTALYIILGIIAALLLILALLLLASVKLSFAYDGELEISVKYLFFSFALTENENGKKLLKLKKTKDKDKDKKEKGKSNKSKKTEKRKKAVLDEIKSLIKLISDVVSFLIREVLPYLKIKIKRFYIICASDDAARCALEYGAVCASASCLFELLEDHSKLSVKSKEAIKIVPDYLASSFSADIKVIVSIPVFRIVTLLFGEGKLLDILGMYK